MNECPICGVVDCGGVVYPYMVSEFSAGRNREHWRRIHDREAMRSGTASAPEDRALQAYVKKHGCCG